MRCAKAARRAPPPSGRGDRGQLLWRHPAGVVDGEQALVTLRPTLSSTSPSRARRRNGAPRATPRRQGIHSRSATPSRAHGPSRAAVRQHLVGRRLHREGLQPSELGWGTHERALPAGGARHAFGCDAANYLKAPGARHARALLDADRAGAARLVITHNESISIADYFTARRRGGEVVYRPTCHYAYHPCDDAVLSLHEMAGAPGSRRRRGTS